MLKHTSLIEAIANMISFLQKAKPVVTRYVNKASINAWHIDAKVRTYLWNHIGKHFYNYTRRCRINIQDAVLQNKIGIK